MNSDWEKAIAFVLKEEGGYSFDPNDRGGETMFGICRRDWNDWPGWKIVEARKALPDFPANINDDPGLIQAAKDFYRVNFWEKCHCDEVPSPLAIALFDGAVNQGVGGAVRSLQIAIGNLEVDGAMGDKTKAAVFKAGPTILRRFLAQRMVRYIRTIMKDNTQEAWADNWSNRLMRLAEIVL